MLIDSLISFVPPGATLSMVGGAGVGIPSGIIDILGLGVGQNPRNSAIIGTATLFGSDPGIGWPRLQAQINIVTALVTGNAATINFKYQAAPDTDVTFQPGTWKTIVESGDLPVTEMNTAGQIPWQFDFEPVRPLAFRPRYLRVLAQVAAATNFTQGAISIPVTTGLNQNRQLAQPNNFIVGAPS